MQRASSPFP
uniref:Uncharacterized protein n=1 Tax=Arundo donax TaxID=35708 RepID=A0A0A9BW98_ARUDO